MSRGMRVVLLVMLVLTAGLVAFTTLLLVGVVSRGGPTLDIVSGACAMVATVAGFLAVLSVFRKSGRGAG